MIRYFCISVFLYFDLSMIHWLGRVENSGKHGKHAWGTHQRKWGKILDTNSDCEAVWMFRVPWGSPVHKLCLSETVSPSLRLPQTHWDYVEAAFSMQNSTMLPHMCQFPAIFEEPIKFLKYAWGTLQLNSHVCDWDNWIVE